MKHFEEGQKLQYVSLYCGTDEVEYYAVGRKGVTDITVIMENGQMAGVPWALVRCEQGPYERKINLAFADIVGLAEEVKK